MAGVSIFIAELLDPTPVMFGALAILVPLNLQHRMLRRQISHGTLILADISLPV